MESQPEASAILDDQRRDNLGSSFSLVRTLVSQMQSQNGNGFTASLVITIHTFKKILGIISRLDSENTNIWMINNKIVISSDQTNTSTQNAYFAYVFYLGHTQYVSLINCTVSFFQISTRTKPLFQLMEFLSKFVDNKMASVGMEIKFGEVEGEITFKCPRFIQTIGCVINKDEKLQLLENLDANYIVKIGMNFFDMINKYSGTLYFNLNMMDYSMISHELNVNEYFTLLESNENCVRKENLFSYLNNINQRSNEGDMLHLLIGTALSRTLLKSMKTTFFKKNSGNLYLNILPKNGRKFDRNNFLQYAYTMNQNLNGTLTESAFYISKYNFVLKLYTEVMWSYEHIEKYVNYIDKKYSIQLNGFQRIKNKKNRSTILTELHQENKDISISKDENILVEENKRKSNHQLNESVIESNRENNVSKLSLNLSKLNSKINSNMNTSKSNQLNQSKHSHLSESNQPLFDGGENLFG